MTLSIGNKAQRVLRLLLGVRNPRIANALAAHGFTEREMEEGWRLLQTLGSARLGILTAPAEVRTLQSLDAWENQWFPIANASLARHFPEAHERVFLNLTQTEGPEVAVSVRVFLERYDAMAAGEDGHGPEGARAAELLAQRGLTAAVIDEARQLLALLARVAPGPEAPFSVEEHKAELARTEEALWAWYLEWSLVARTAIKQRVLLRQLGFLGDRSTPVEEEDVEDTEKSGIVATDNAAPAGRASGGGGTS